MIWETLQWFIQHSFAIQIIKKNKKTVNICQSYSQIWSATFLQTRVYSAIRSWETEETEVWWNGCSLYLRLRACRALLTTNIAPLAGRQTHGSGSGRRQSFTVFPPRAGWYFVERDAKNFPRHWFPSSTPLLRNLQSKPGKATVPVTDLGWSKTAKNKQTFWK